MAYSEKAVLDALSKIKDPFHGTNLVSSGRIGDLNYANGQLRVILKIDPKQAEAFQALQGDIETTLGDLDGIEKASVILTAHKAAPEVGRRPQRSANPHQARRPDGYQGDAFVDHVVAVSSAKGGVGKSTVAVNLAVALARQGKNVGLLDADVHGPSVPILMGLRGKRATTTKVQGRPLIKPFKAFDVKVMSIGFLTDDDGPVVWRGPMVQGAISKMLWDVDWGNLDVLIIDMPPGTGDPQLGLAQDIKPRGAVIVSTPQDLALADARKGVAMFGQVDIPVLGIVENMSVFICPDCGSSHDIFGTGGAKAEAEKLGVPLLGQAPLHMAIRQSGDAGEPIAASKGEEAKHFSEMAERLWAQLK